VTVEGAVSADTTVHWQPVVDAKAYKVYWRETTAPQWQHSRTVPASATSLLLQNTVTDDWFFGVAAIGEQGLESPAEFPGEIGRFIPAAKP
jgi:hypothetical protein